MSEEILQTFSWAHQDLTILFLTDYLQLKVYIIKVIVILIAYCLTVKLK